MLLKPGCRDTFVGVRSVCSSNICMMAYLVPLGDVSVGLAPRTMVGSRTGGTVPSPLTSVHSAVH